MLTLYVCGRKIMTALLNYDHSIGGSVKFDASVPVATLAVFIKEMRSSNPERWIDLHIRSSGDDGTHYIAFHYILSDGKEKTCTKAINRLLQYLCDQLGICPNRGKKNSLVPHGVKGWSISTVVRATA